MLTLTQRTKDTSFNKPSGGYFPDGWPGIKSQSPAVLKESRDNNRRKDAQKQVAGREHRFYLKVMIISCLGWLLTFEAVGHYASTLPARDFTTFLDQKIPLIPEFIWFYVSCYFLPVLFLITKADWHRFNRMLLSFVMANLSAFLVYLIYPTTFSKPELGRSLCEWILSLHYAVDFHPVSKNMPSMHVTFAWLFYLACRGQQMNRLTRFTIFLLAVMIAASTLFVKQHLIVDVVAGLLWACWAWPVAKHLYRLLTDPRAEPRTALRQMARSLTSLLFLYGGLLFVAIGYRYLYFMFDESSIF